jgi:hypothetical protein
MLSLPFLDAYGRNQLYGMLWYCFCFYFNSGKQCGTIMFGEATGTTISCCLGRWYGPMLSQSFLDVYGTNQVYGMPW